MSDAKQDQKSGQSSTNPSGKPQASKPSEEKARTGIGSSQGQDREDRPSGNRDGVPRTGEGTADIERASAEGQGRSESLTDDPVGAYKERP